MVLEVLASERLSPHMMRLTFGGPGFANFQDKAVSDRYVKILFTRPELGLQPPYDLDDLREKLAPEDFPVRRTYTLRHVDLEAQTLQIDFVIHGDQGIAGPWALNAKLGDQICFTSPGGLYTPNPEFDRHLLVGDESALPVISAAVEDMTEDMIGDIYLEVSGPEDEVRLDAPAGITVHWLHRGGYYTPENTKLEETVRNAEWHEGTLQVFAHGERETMKSLRAYLNGERGVDRRAMSLSAYWAYGRAEDEFQAEKKSPIGQIYPETLSA
ncbi:siderophore-interacting protein [Paeniglutamicibacter gangotriensis]|uniref:Siderophore-interacting protein n=1 Tax=Paeniglutamicibacter gangotriensis TaxID=254787 RepID=A0A5B0EJ61_9MICC|nr:siderophore-interacting protein [Paeniglutamicibacter gangotriensis]